MEYFYIENNSQMGPLSVDLLITQIKPDTKVWCPGMSDWTRASEVPELALAMGLDHQEPQDLSGYPPNVEASSQYQGGNSNSPEYQTHQQQPTGLGQNVSGGYPAAPNNANTYMQNGAYNNGANNNGMRKPDNYLVLAIISTVLCCWPAGIVSIVKAAKVDSCWARGEFDEARRNSDEAKKWAIISIVVALLVIVLYFVFIIFAAANGY
ncbi:MAG: CD225/dispanin family protein [Bacteroidales bacterium]|nr:CD225/dispanin family protein [Bacteroidales bacterium]